VGFLVVKTNRVSLWQYSKLSKILGKEPKPAKTLKTKRKWESPELLPASIDISSYKIQMVGEEKDQKETLHLLVKMILALDGGLSKTSSMLVKLLSDFNKSLQMQELLPQMLQHKVETTKQLLVVKPTALARNLDAPSV
jgi:hypothetical protein